MKRKKLIIFTALFLAMILFLSGCGNNIGVKELFETISQNDTFNIKDGDEYTYDNLKYYQTQEKNIEKVETRTLIFNQPLLFSFGDLIFRGTYLYEENYTLEFDEIIYLPDETSTKITNQHYFTYYKFKVVEIFKGDKSLENTEIYLMNRNLDYNKDEVIFQAENEYFLFSTERTDAFDEMPEMKPLIKSDYWFSPSQYVFPVKDNYVYSTDKLIAYNKLISENYDYIFMNDWLDKQISKKTTSIPDKNLEIDSIYDENVNLGISDEKNTDMANVRKNIIKEWRIESIITSGGENERVCIPIDTFTDFLISAIEYYSKETLIE